MVLALLDVTLTDGGWSRELRKSSPSCLLPLQPLLVGLVEWGRSYEKKHSHGSVPLCLLASPPLAAGVLLSLCNSFHQNHLQPLLFFFINLNSSLHVSGILGGFWRKEGSKGAIFSSTVFVRQYHPRAWIYACLKDWNKMVV